MKLYLDIDGVLITAKNPNAPEGIDAFLEYVSSNFDCHWLTTHCKGDASACIQYLKQYLSNNSLVSLSKIKPTTWDTLKTEAIDMEESFYWLDDYPMMAEKKELEKHGKLDSLIQVNLNNQNELERIIKILKNE